MNRTQFAAPLLCLFLSVLWISAMMPGSTSAANAGMATDAASKDAPRLQRLQVGVPQRLNEGPLKGRFPSVIKTKDGTVSVAWEQDIAVPGRRPKQQIYARLAPDGSHFQPAVSLSTSNLKSRQPFLFSATTGVEAVFDQQDASSSFSILDSSLSSAGWSSPSRVASSLYNTALDPVGVQTGDGKIWVLWQQGHGGTWTDAVVQQVGGPQFNLSRDGSAARHPALAAGDHGDLYVAWIDHGNEKPGVSPGVKVRQWDGTRWIKLTPDPYGSADCSNPSLAFHDGNLYLAWAAGASPSSIRVRVWNGSSWGPAPAVLSKPAGSWPEIFVPASGNVYIVWTHKGVIYLQKNSEPAVSVSPGIAGATKPALFVDDNDAAYVVFQTGKMGGGIYYETTQ